MFENFLFSIFFAPDDPPSGGQLDDEEEKDEPQDEALEDEADPEEDEGEDEGEDWDHARGMSTIRKLRKEVKDKSKREKQLEAELSDFRKERQRREDEEKSELQLAQEKAEALERDKQELEDRLRTNAIKSSIEREARDLGFVDAEDAYHLIVARDSELELDEDKGTVKGAKKLLKDLADEKPYLLENEDQGKNRTPIRGRKPVPAERLNQGDPKEAQLVVPVDF